MWAELELKSAELSLSLSLAISRPPYPRPGQNRERPGDKAAPGRQVFGRVCQGSQEINCPRSPERRKTGAGASAGAAVHTERQKGPARQGQPPNYSEGGVGRGR